MVILAEEAVPSVSASFRPFTSTPVPMSLEELRENIILHLPQEDIMAFRSVCQAWRNAIDNNTTIQKKLFRKPCFATAITNQETHHQTVEEKFFYPSIDNLAFEINPRFFEHDANTKRIHFRVEPNGSALLLTQPPVKVLLMKFVISYRFSVDDYDVSCDATQMGKVCNRDGSFLRLRDVQRWLDKFEDTMLESREDEDYFEFLQPCIGHSVAFDFSPE